MSDQTKRRPPTGVEAAAELLKGLDPEHRAKLLADVQARDPKIAEALRKKIVLFEDILGWDDSKVQTWLNGIALPRLAVAMRGCNEAVEKKIFSNLPKRAQEALREERAGLGPQKKSEIAAAQNELFPN